VMITDVCSFWAHYVHKYNNATVYDNRCMLHTRDSTFVSTLQTTRSLFELPFLSTHRTKLINLLRVEPLDNTVNVEAVRTLAPHYNNVAVLSHSLAQSHQLYLSHISHFIATTVLFAQWQD